MQPPEGPPVCTALIVPPSATPPPMSSTMSPQRRAHRHFDQPGVAHLAGQREDLGPLALLRADAGEPVGPVAEDGRDVGEGLDVVDEGRAAPQTLLGRDRAAAASGHAALALDRCHQRRFFAADEGAGADAHVDAEIERRARRRSLPSRPSFLRLLDGLLQAARRRADIRPARRCSPGWRRRRSRRWPCPPARDADRSPARCDP